jgi:uncharacterized protein YecA (UPF0149 family)
MEDIIVIVRMLNQFGFALDEKQRILAIFTDAVQSRKNEVDKINLDYTAAAAEEKRRYHNTLLELEQKRDVELANSNQRQNTTINNGLIAALQQAIATKIDEDTTT